MVILELYYIILYYIILTFLFEIEELKLLNLGIQVWKRSTLWHTSKTSTTEGVYCTYVHVFNLFHRQEYIAEMTSQLSIIRGKWSMWHCVYHERYLWTYVLHCAIDIYKLVSSHIVRMSLWGVHSNSQRIYDHKDVFAITAGGLIYKYVLNVPSICCLNLKCPFCPLC